MFLLSILLLFPAILATGREVQINDNYVVKFSRDFPNAQNPVRRVVYRAGELNLSGLRIRRFKDNAFKNVSFVRILDLSNNLLTKIPDLLFASLTNLEHLNLSHNRIYKIRRPFFHLNNLKNLNLSNNRLTELRERNFFGLTTSCVILLKNNDIRNMSTELFENDSCPPKKPVNHTLQNTREEPLFFNQSVKCCIDDSELISVEYYTEGEKLAPGCSNVIYDSGILRLSSLRIAKFQKGWYKLGDFHEIHIDLSSNNIISLTSEVFNDLPKSVYRVDLAYNKIERLEQNIIANKYLKTINFQSNFIFEIEDNAFTYTDLKSLYLNSNKLTNTRFATTLPRDLRNIDLYDNEITEIFPESFLKLNKLESLTLDSNYITVINRDSLVGLNDFDTFSQFGNGIQKIEEDSLEDIMKMRRLEDAIPLISSVFGGLETLSNLSLARNNITRIEKGAFESLGSLCELVLSGNPIEKLESGTLHGLIQRKGCNVYLQDVPIEIIHGGVFARRDHSFNCLSESN